MNPSLNDVEQALQDVRRAFRILHGYQRAALDTAKYIGSQLGFDYRDGYPRFSDPAPKHGKGAFDCWAWDWLNFVHYDFNFRKIVERSEINLTIMLLSDTGIYYREPREVDEPDQSTFASVENFKTKIGLLLFRDWPDEWDDLLYNPGAMRHFIEHDGELPEAISAEGCIGKCFDFARVSTDPAAEEVITELIQFAQDKGYSLERIKKTA